MKFEWDETKNELNLKKHGLDFFDAWEIFEAPVLVGIDKRNDYEEDRFIGLGILRNFVVVVVFTEKIGDTIRVISLRRAKKYERQKFFEYLKNQLGTPGDDE